MQSTGSSSSTSHAASDDKQLHYFLLIATCHKEPITLYTKRKTKQFPADRNLSQRIKSRLRRKKKDKGGQIAVDQNDSSSSQHNTTQSCDVQSTDSSIAKGSSSSSHIPHPTLPLTVSSAASKTNIIQETKRRRRKKRRKKGGTSFLFAACSQVDINTHEKLRAFSFEPGVHERLIFSPQHDSIACFTFFL